jgi:hypothetical protein
VRKQLKNTVMKFDNIVYGASGKNIDKNKEGQEP